MKKLKYKIGDIVQIVKVARCEHTGLRDDLIGRKGRILKTDNSEIPYKIYLIDYTQNDVENEIDYFYWVSEECIESVRRRITPTTLEELPIGSIITTSEDEHFQYVKIDWDEFRNDDCGTLLARELTEKLRFSATDGQPKLVEIAEPIYYTTYDESDEPVEMTIEEISEKLGYNIKIVKSK